KAVEAGITALQCAIANFSIGQFHVQIFSSVAGPDWRFSDMVIYRDERLGGEGEDGSPVEAGAEGCEDDGGCGWGGVGGVPLGGGDEEGGGGGVAVAVDVAEETVFGDRE